MKKHPNIGVLLGLAFSLLVFGCASNSNHEDSFIILHGAVKQALVADANCGPIVTNEVIGGRYFEVKPEPRGWSINVSERQFLSQAEWDKRHDSGTNLASQFMAFLITNQLKITNHTIAAEALERFPGFTNDFGLSGLPAWHYRNTGVDVAVQDVEVVYPGSDQDYAEAQKRYQNIVKLLKAYRQSDANSP